MPSVSSLRAGFSALVLTLLLLGCGGASNDGTSSGAWTIQEGALTLTETLRAGDDEDYFFGEIADVAARTDERVYVADEGIAHVKVLTPDGTLQATIGRKGKGPGEFNRPEQVQLARGDSLYVVDGYRSELSVFAPNHDFAYRVSLRLRPEKKRILVPGTVMVRQNSPLYVIRYGAISPPGVEAPNGSAIRPMSASGRVGDTLFTVPDQEMHVTREERRTTVRSIPYARGSFVTMGPAGRVHSAWSDSLGIRTYGLDGTLQRTVDIPFEPVPVTETDREHALADRSKKGRAAVEDEIPATKPAFDQFLVDDVNRYWFGRPTRHPDSTAWWVVWPEEQRVVATMLPSDVQLYEVTNGRAYGRTTTENGAPALVRYRIHIDN